MSNVFSIVKDTYETDKYFLTSFRDELCLFLVPLMIKKIVKICIKITSETPVFSASFL